MEGLESLFHQRVYLDTNIFLYAFEAIQPWKEVAQTILASVESGSIHSITSELTLAECLVRPMQLNQTENVALYQQAIQSSSSFDVMPISRDILITAADIRASTGNKLPDSIHIATARLCGCSYFLTNDRRLTSLAKPDVVLVSEFTER